MRFGARLGTSSSNFNYLVWNSYILLDRRDSEGGKTSTTRRGLREVIARGTSL